MTFNKIIFFKRKILFFNLFSIVHGHFQMSVLVLSAASFSFCLLSWRKLGISVDMFQDSWPGSLYLIPLVFCILLSMSSWVMTSDDSLCTAAFSVHVRHIGVPLCSTKKYSVSDFSLNCLCSSPTFLFMVSFEKGMVRDKFSFHLVSLQNHIPNRWLALLIHVS